MTYTVKRERVTWCRWDHARRRSVMSRRWAWTVTEPDGYERSFDTKDEAQEWIAAELAASQGQENR